MNHEGEELDTLTADEFDKLLAFFIMPGSALKELRSELLAVTNQRMTSAILFRFGFRCGAETVKKIDVSKVEVEELEELLPDLWAEIGLSRLSLLECNRDSILIEFKEPMEAFTKERLTEPGCDFTRGYLSGLIRELTGIPYYSVEERCVSVGDPVCKIRLSKEKVNKD